MMQMFRLDTLTSAPGTPSLFNGSVAVAPLPLTNTKTLTSLISAGYVIFQPTARSRWHSHPAGQLLIISGGEGVVQQLGEAPLLMQAGYAVWAPPNVTHWHGAGVRGTVSHTAIQEVIDGVNAFIGAVVSDEEYQAAVNQLGIGEGESSSYHATVIEAVLVPVLLLALLLLVAFMWRRRRRNQAASAKEALSGSALDSNRTGTGGFTRLARI